MRFVMLVLFFLCPFSALAVEWEAVAPIKGDPRVLLLSYNAGTIRALLDERCGGRRVACVAAVPATHPKRGEYAEHWYRQCMQALDEARRVGDLPSWTVFDRRGAGDEWLLAPQETVGAVLLCEPKAAKPALPSPTPTAPAPKPKDKPKEPKWKTVHASTVLVAPLAPRVRDEVEFAVAVIGESWYGLARGELDGLGVGAAGLELKLTDALLACLRVEIGSSQRAGTPYLWVGGLACVSAPLGEMIEVGGFVRWHHGFLGPESSRDRLGIGARVVIPRFIADNLGLEVLIGAARDLAPGYGVENGRYTEENDLTVGLAVGVFWLPFL